MKRLITYISILAVALTAGVSCSREAAMADQEGGSLELFFRTAEMGTRAVSVTNGNPVVGEGAENVITHVDYFFFQDENPASEAIVSGRLTTASGELVKQSETLYKTPDHFIDTDDYPELKGPSYLYVLVNYPEEVTAKTMNDLLALPISTDFTKAQTSFVMDSFSSETESGLIYLTPKGSGEARRQEVNVARVAAKLVLNMKVKKSIVDKTNDTWTPDLDQMWVNFLYARKTATVSATPMKFDDKTNYYNTEQAAPQKDLTKGNEDSESEEEDARTGEDANYTYWTVPAVYTYPQKYETSDVTAPYFKIFIPWISQRKGLNNFYYKIILPELGSFQRNKIYHLDVDVSVLGGTEDDWALFSDYIYVDDWFNPAAIPTVVESARYLDVPVKKYEIYGINEITVPVVSSNDIEIVSVVGRQSKVTETLGTTEQNPIGSSATHPIRTNTCVPNGSQSFTLTYNLDATIQQSERPSFDCSPIEWKVTIKHKETTDEPYLTKTVTITIYQYPSIYARLLNGENSFVNGYYTVQTASVTPKPTNESNSNGYYRYQNGGTYRSGPSEAQSYGRLNTDYSKTKTMTLVTVGAFAPGSDSYSVISNGDGAAATKYEYIIGDPRISSGWDSDDLFPYLNGNSTKEWTDADAGKIKIGTNLKKNIISPAFLIASEIGGRPGSVDSSLNFDGATKRCATYQEAGYPAGRWRLPTEAELYFLYSLQNMKTIANLFNGGNGYWASSGNVFGESVNNVDNYTFRAGNAGHNGEHSIRCVYDIWYWGEEAPGALHSYSIMP